MRSIYSSLIKALHSAMKNQQYQKAVIGLSGGLDSAIVLCLANRALGSKNVHALILPETGITPGEDTEHALMLAEHFGISYSEKPINNFLVDYNFLPWDNEKEARLRLKAQTRGNLIKHYSKAEKAFILGTANRSDLLLGFGELGAEFVGHVQPLGDLFKSELPALGEFIGLPKALLEKAPSRQLELHQSDQKELGMPWDKVDEVLRQLSTGIDPETLLQKGMDSLSVHKIARMLQQNENVHQKVKTLGVSSLSDAVNRAQSAEATS